MIRNVLARHAATLVCVLASSAAMASGSDGGSSAETGDTAAYNMGKSIYATKLACTGCPMAGKSLDAAMSKDLLAKAPVTLSADESKALEVYLKRRFKL